MTGLLITSHTLNAFTPSAVLSLTQSTWTLCRTFVMEVDDLVVPTSDQDELEEFAATTSTRTYWSRNASDIARRREVPKPSTAQQHDELFVSSSDTRSRSSPPRKRRKVCMEIVFGSVPVLNSTAGQYPGWWPRVNASLTAHQYPRCFACDR